MVMLIPLGVLAIGSIAAGWPFSRIFTGHGADGFLPRVARISAPPTRCSRTCEQLPLLLSLSPTVMMIGGFLVAWQFYIRRPDLPVALARASSACSTSSCSTNGISTRSTTSSSCVPTMLARPPALEGRRRLAHRRLRA